MKKTLIAYGVFFLLFAILLYFLSMSWMNFLFRPNLRKEVEIILSEVPDQHPFLTESQMEGFSKTVEQIPHELGLFVSHFEYYKKLAPAFTQLKDTGSFLDFWKGTIHSASVFPYLFAYRDGALIIKASVGNLIPSGAVVKSINGKSTEEIMTFYQQFVYAQTEDESRFWACERDLINYYPEFFQANRYQLKYQYEGKTYEEIAQKIPWNEWMSWKKRLESQWYSLKTYDTLAVLKIYDLSYSQQNIFEMKQLMQELIEDNPARLLIDLTDAKGIGENYYNLQVFLSFLSQNEGYLVPKQITKYHQQTDAYAIIPQNEIFQGDLFFLISKYSLYPYIKALISFCERTNTGVFLGEAPLSFGSYFSNPYQEPLYISYLVPKVCRTYNELENETLEGLIIQEISFSMNDYIQLLMFEKDFLEHFNEID